MVDSAIGKKKGATGADKNGKRTTRKKKPEAAVQTAEVLELEAFQESMQPEPPVHVVVLDTPTRWASLASEQDGPGKDRNFSITVAREALQTMVWDRRHFFLRQAMPWKSRAVVAVSYTHLTLPTICSV